MSNNGTTCCICGKPLTDPISVEMGIGPVCRTTRKTRLAKSRDGNLFANRSKYRWGMIEGIAWVEDQGGMKSATNDMDQIVRDLAEKGVDFSTTPLIYRDSLGIWDGVEINQGTGSIAFYSINERDFAQATRKVKYLRQPKTAENG